tara:strand:- start:13216 stop:14250 length:1035 start_codon:yes stop_codon:yes gene_type:complete
MKISYVVDNHSPAYGGPYTVISEQLKYLYKNNVDAELIFNTNSFKKFSRDYKSIIKNTDIVHIFGIWRPFHIKAFIASKKLKKKIVISTLGALEPWALSQRNLKKKIAWYLYQKRILNNVNYIHATSQMESENLINLGIKSPIKVLPHGLEINENLSKFKEKQKNKAIFFSRIHHKKGLLELIRSWSKIGPSNWELDIYGPVSDDNYFHKIKKEIESSQYSQSIKIFDPVYIKEKKFEILFNSDLFILPSKSENFGMSILEALSLGVPVLTTTSTPWKILNSLNAGFVIEFSEQNILNALNNIIKMKNHELNTVGNNGKEFVKKNYDIKNLIKNYINFYNEIHK